MLLEGYIWFLLVQHLDDFIMFGPVGDDRVDRMYRRYCSVCADVGVSLQEPADAAMDKAYAPTRRGSILEIWFDTVSWTWWISEEKVARYTNDLLDMLSQTMTTQKKVWESVGKVLYVGCLLPGSKYHVSEMLKANNMSDDPSETVVITKALKKELSWWVPMIRLIGMGMPIPSSFDVCPVNALQADSDAAGGSVKGGAGCGIVMGKLWSQIPWSPYVNSDARCLCGAMFRHQLSFLEMVGHLLHVTVFAEEVNGRAIRTNIDNQGTVRLAKKGRAYKCPLMDTLIKATNHVAVALNCRAYVVKVRRCSTGSAKAADALSKSNYRLFRELVPGAEEYPRVIPVAVRSWLADPKPDMDLGRRIVLELKYWGVDVLDRMS